MIYSSIRPGRRSDYPTVTDLRLIQYDPNGKMYYKLNFNDELRELPGRPKQKPTVCFFPERTVYTLRAKIPHDKWNNLQFLKELMPSDTHSFLTT